jgi:hypothetical protein
MFVVELQDRARMIQFWDLPFESSTYRVHLRPEALEVDLAFTPRGRLSCPRSEPRRRLGLNTGA